VCIALCTIVAHNIAQNRPDSFPPYPPDDHHSSDDVYLREGGGSETTNRMIFTKTKILVHFYQKNPGHHRHFPWLSMTLPVFYDFPGLENGLSKFHNFPWHSRKSGHPVNTLRTLDDGTKQTGVDNGGLVAGTDRQHFENSRRRPQQFLVRRRSHYSHQLHGTAACHYYQLHTSDHHLL